MPFACPDCRRWPARARRFGLILAGTLAYWQGWAFIVVFTIATNIIGIYLALKDPALLERRIKAGPAPRRDRCERR